MSRAFRYSGLILACALVVVACGGHTAGAAGNGTATRAAAGAPAAAPTATSSSVPGGDWPEFDYNPQRSGVGPSDTGIIAANLGGLTLRRVKIDGIADSSAIELHAVVVRGRRRDVIFVTTSYGKTIALDAGSGAKLWEFSPTGVSGTAGNPPLTTASPVADPGRRYVFAASPGGVIYKLSVTSGRVAWARSITFDPRHEKIASALNVSGPNVVAVTAGYFGDIPPYDGHVVTIGRSSGRVVRVWNTECSDRHALIRASSCAVTNTHGDNAIWGRAGAVIEPGSGRILVATGNGPFDGSTSWGDSVLELSADAGRLLHNWTPRNQLALDHSDSDIGSASPAILPPYHGFRLVVQTAKDGRLHLLDLGRLDGGTGGPGPRLGGEVQELPAPGGAPVFTAPAVWKDGPRVFAFVADNSGTAAYELIGGGRPRLRVTWHNTTSGTSPVVAGGLLYVYDELNGRLDIRRPSDGTLLRALPVAGGHWNSPVVVGGRIIEPTGSYMNAASSSTIDIYHLPGR